MQSRSKSEIYCSEQNPGNSLEVMDNCENLFMWEISPKRILAHEVVREFRRVLVIQFVSLLCKENRTLAPEWVIIKTRPRETRPSTWLAHGIVEKIFVELCAFQLLALLQRKSGESNKNKHL